MDRRRFTQPPFTLPEGATEVVLVRHGASAHAVRGKPFPKTDGWADPPLAPEGALQAAAIADALAGEPLAGLFVSGLKRTVLSAAPLAEAMGLEPIVVPDLREVHVGDWEGGELRIRIADGDPLALRVFAEERWDLIPNAEDPAAFGARLRRGIDRIIDAVGADAVAAAFVHGGVVAELCRQATGSRPFAFIHADNGSISRLVVLADGRWLLRSFNDTSHLNQLRSRLPAATGAEIVVA